MEEKGRRKTGRFLKEVKLLPHTNILLNTDQVFVCHVGEC